ncbi:MAG: ABC transporter substrate-binding protein [Candidatus Rokubacteria bacterium]|nr:ABC transporter substrate-binding protein [Candidatus Rokubacteria bacterium]MBI3824471.1 ABC transporter substrate-binding protein [Candidatus Rokubacteria bacterium]
MKRLALVLVALAAVSAVPAAAQDQRPGGVFKAAMIGEPPSLDLHWTTATITQQITWHVYETLYTFDRNFNPMPLLAEGQTVADGGRRYTIRLRHGVKFHNGKEMTSADVVASLTRWGRISTSGKPLWKNVEAVEAKDPYTVMIHLKESSGVLLVGLARPNNGAVIYPREIAEAAGDNQTKDVIGTGPYRFVEHKPDRHIKLARFKDYAGRSEAPDGYAGKRTALLDEILFIPVPDVAVRIAGVETGEYHFAQQIKQDQYDRIKALPGVVPSIIKPSGWSTAVFNHKQGLMTDKRLRLAFQAALDMEPIMAAGFGNRDFYRLDPGLLYQEQTAWYTKAGGELYNQKNRAKAAALLKEAGYAGQPVRWVTTKEYEWMYKNALVAKQQLEEAGFKIDLQVVDWATLVQRRNKPELFDVFSTGFGFVSDPAFMTSAQCNWPGWWCHEEKDRLIDGLIKESDPKKRRAMFERIQVLFYEDAGRIKFGDSFTLDILRKEVRGFKTTPETFFWNVSLSK